MDTRAFQGQWKEHMAPLLQWQNYTGIDISALFGKYVLKI